MKLKRKKIEVKEYWSPDIYNPWIWEPTDNNVFYLLEMSIGISDENSADIYSVIIATPEGIYSLKDKKNMLNQEYKLILIDEYSWKEVISIIESIVSGIDLNLINNDYISQELCKHFYWEYDSMR